MSRILVFSSECFFGKDDYADIFGRFLPTGTEIGIADDDDVLGPSENDSEFAIGDFMTNGLTIFLFPDFCDEW